MTQEARLTLSGVHLPGGEDPLGIWELSSRDEPVAFAASAGGEGPVWRIDLPQATREVRADLRAQREAVRGRERQLTALEARLARLDLSPSYAVPLDAHEAELLRAVTVLRSPAIAFDPLAPERFNYREIYAQCEALFAQFRALVRPVARVETVTGGRWIALTAIDWNGDHSTTWLEKVAPADMEVHLAAVQLAMASRQTLLRLCVVVVTGALELALKAHIPGGQILLLPAVYRFVRDVLQELEHLKDGGAVA
jgi:hypothetical protein